jgi:hypothetical protein
LRERERERERERVTGVKVVGMRKETVSPPRVREREGGGEVKEAVSVTFSIGGGVGGSTTLSS